MNISIFRRFLNKLGVPTYNSTTGDFSTRGARIPAALPILLADFLALDFTQFDGVFYRVSDLHSTGATGGSLWMADGTGDRPVLKDSPPRTTYANALANFPAASYPGLRLHMTNVGPNGTDMRSNGARYTPDNGTAMLGGEGFGTIANPTNTRTTTGEFPVSIPDIPANLLSVGDRLRLTLRFNKSSANGTYYVRTVIGTTVDVGNAMVHEATSGAATTGYQIQADVLLTVGSATVLTTNRGFGLSGAGAAPAAYDITTNVNIASPLKLGIWLGAITATDTAALLSYSLRWEV